MADLWNSSENISKIYQDEPVPAAKNPTPPKYREMREIAAGYSSFYTNMDAELFYTQAKFMEDFEDDFEDRSSFMAYFPTYHAMNIKQLRTYFSWRTKLRQGIIQKIPLSYIYVYIYELLHHIGSKTPEDGYNRLMNFWMDYSQLDPNPGLHVARWLSDYIIYYKLDKSLLEDLSKTEESALDSAVIALLDCKTHDADEVFAAADLLSSYKISQSVFFHKYREDMKTFIHRVFSAVLEAHGMDRNGEYFFGKFCTSSYHMFRGAVFFCQDQKDIVYEINEIYKYRCEGVKWSLERFLPYSGKEQKITALLKNIDYFMRKEYGLKSSLRPAKTDEFKDIIQRELNIFIQEKQLSALPKVELDLSKLHNIRSDALDTQNKLIVEELSTVARPQFSDGRPMAAPTTNIALNSDELELLNCLLIGKAYNSKNAMLSVLVDGINEKLFDRFGDNVIIDGEKSFEIVSDYAEELKGFINANP